RFVMNGFHKKKAGIGKYAFFYGVGPHFEIWDPATLLATGKYELMREHLEFLLDEKGIVL
ncbi:MAG: division/cell wall cluster transcriptional repressor MraZ, partial [Sphingomonas sp.]